MTSRDTVHRLARVLDAEERLYVELRDLLQHERECMLNLDAEGLERAVESKEGLVEEARLLEESRIEVARELARSADLDDERPTLSQLCEALGSRGDPLRERHSRLAALLGAVGELVDANASFAREGLAQVQETIQMLGRMLPQEPVYRGAEVPRAERGAGRLVRSVA
jgi:flagellar biosynthesis/type III secretory pathway chaperone